MMQTPHPTETHMQRAASSAGPCDGLGAGLGDGLRDGRTVCVRRLRVLAGLPCASMVCLLSVMGTLAGCGSSDETRTERMKTVEPAAFLAGPGEAGAVEAMPEVARLPAASGNEGDLGIGGTAGGGGMGGGGQDRVRSATSFRVVPGAPALLGDAGAPIEPPQLLDAKVGDINGRPVFVSEFLRPIEGRLRAEAGRLGRTEWMKTAAGIIQEEMRSLITDELLRAEALSRLSVDQKAGLRRFLDDVRRNLLSQNRGSQQLAEDRLRREEGLSQEEFLRQREDRTLVRFTLQEEIQDRINVSWRDIVRRYARDESKYNPAPLARYYFVRVSADDAAAIDEVQNALSSGSAFSDIAASPVNTWTLDEGAFRDVPMPGGGVAVNLFPMAELNDPAAALGVGETTEAIPFGSSVMWIHLASIDRQSTSLYDAQLAISNEIRNERTADELERYIDRLLGRASVTDVERMLVRLLAIAEQRYGPTAAPAAGRP